MFLNNLSKPIQCLFALIAFLVVSFGQPAWYSWLGLIASIAGYALFWRVLLEYPSWKMRFLLGVAWFSCVQLIQLSWFISHPYWYIYLVYLFLSIMLGIQFGILSLFITPKYIQKSVFSLLSIAALWVIFEWSRLLPLSGFSFNPVGGGLTGNVYSLQMASLAGIFGLSFWVILVNLCALRAWLQPPKRKFFAVLLWLILAITPYVFGFFQISYHEHMIAETKPKHLKVVLVQTAFLVEEMEVDTLKNSLEDYVLGEWRQILKICKKHDGQPIDLIVLPEFVVPFGTYAFVFPLEKVMQIFKEEFKNQKLTFLKNIPWPLIAKVPTQNGSQVMVNNAYWVQAIANYFNADVMVGLEDAEKFDDDKIEIYNAALFLHPQLGHLNHEFSVERYEKRVLVPMGEYIPFDFLRRLVANYGVFGSFTCGKEAKVMSCQNVLIAPSICYEETFGHLMCESRQKGANLFVNMTSDVWYPNSKLPLQHLEHSRARTVENGIPLVRACNTGITAAIDCFGRDIAVLGGDHPEKVEWVPDSLYVDVPLYNFSTLYSRWGDYLLIVTCFVIVIGFCLYKSLNKK